LRPILVDVNVIPLDSPTSPVPFGRDYDSHTQKVLVAQNKEENSSTQLELKMSTGVGVSECCLSGKVHEGTPTGKIETIDNLQTYVAAPKDGSKAKSIVFIVDSKSYLSMFDVLELIHPQFSGGNSRTFACLPITTPKLGFIATFQMFTKETLFQLSSSTPWSLISRHVSNSP
jgi:hypothetical protein